VEIGCDGGGSLVYRAFMRYAFFLPVSEPDGSSVSGMRYDASGPFGFAVSDSRGFFLSYDVLVFAGFVFVFFI